MTATKTFVVPDIHGRYELLRRLLLKAGVINEDDRRTDEVEYEELRADGVHDGLDKRWFRVVSIGDLANGTLEDMVGDEACLAKARDWFDYLILGNHESGYLFSNMGFNGYHPAPHLRSLYNQLFREGYVVPAVLVGETLLTHAGLVKYFNFETAEEAFDAIYEVWENYREYDHALAENVLENSDKLFFTLGGSSVVIPKSLLLDAVSNMGGRGGSAPFGGILWADWDEAKTSNFSQIVGHSPRANGPILTTYQGSGVFTLDIDCGAKLGALPTGVWLDEYGMVEEYVTVAD